MAPPIIYTIAEGLLTNESTFETIYPIDSTASESAKLLKISRAFKSREIDMAKIVNVNLYGYISTESQMNSVTERNERAAMNNKLNAARDQLLKMGVSDDKIWKGGIAYSPNRSGQIDVSVREVNLNTIILPPYTPYVPPANPQTPPNQKEQWLDSDGSAKKDVLKDVISIEIEISLKEGGIFRTKPPVSAKASAKSDGKIELGAEWTPIKEEIAKKVLWGAVQEVKFKISAKGGVKMKFDDKKFHSELNASVKAALSATLVIPGTSIKIPVEVSIGVNSEGKVEPGLSVTYRW
jgi:hypothetical protein